MPAKGLPIADRSRGRPFEKGKSGNPSGSSKERIAANKALQQIVAVDPDTDLGGARRVEHLCGAHSRALQQVVPVLSGAD